MAACGIEASRIGTAPETRLRSRPWRRRRRRLTAGMHAACPADPNGVVPAGARQSMGSQEVRALLVARKQLLGRLIDVELSIRGILRGFGLKVGQVTRKTFEARIRELATGQATLERIAMAMLSARAALKAEYAKLHKAVLAIVREDAVCRRLMTVPGVGPLVAIDLQIGGRRSELASRSRRRWERCSGSRRRSISRGKGRHRRDHASRR